MNTHRIFAVLIENPTAALEAADEIKKRVTKGKQATKKEFLALHYFP